MNETNEADLWIWNKLHWFNFPNLPEREASQDEHLKKRILPSIQFNNNKPLYVYLHNCRIPELEDIQHSIKDVEYLNQIGVTFYLNEPLCLYVDGQEHTFIFYSEFVGNELPENLRSTELDSIRDYAIKHGLTNIKVKTCDYRVEEFLPYYKEWMAVSCDDSFVKNAVIVNVKDTTFSNNFSKKFINLNWRWTPHRNFIAAYLVRGSSKVSFFYKTDTEKLSSLPWTDFSNWPKEYKDRVDEGLSYIDDHGPFCLDIPFNDLLDVVGQPYPVNTTIDDYVDPAEDLIQIESFYRDAFCDVVTESRFAQPTSNYSEKAHQPMFYKKPFIMLAPPRTLQYLREQGYKTFSDYWDESYDLCENHTERLFKIFEVVKYIESKSIEELQSLYESMKPLLEHNYNQVRNNIYQWY